MLRLTQSDWCIRENSSRYRVAILLRFFCAAAMLYFFNVFFGSSGEVACDCQLCWIPCHNGLFNANVRCINNLIAMETFKKKQHKMRSWRRVDPATSQTKQNLGRGTSGWTYMVCLRFSVAASASSRFAPHAE
jgi:hypothetical protein